MDSSKSRDHRIRVLENQMRLAAERDGVRADAQMRMPLLVEVTNGGAAAKQRVRRTRRGSRKGQPELGGL